MAKKRTNWIEHPTWDEDQCLHVGRYSFNGNSVRVNLDCEASDLAEFTSLAQTLFEQWPPDEEDVAASIVEELKMQTGDVVSRQLELVPFSLDVSDAPEGADYSIGLEVAAILDDDEFVDIAGDIAGSWKTVEIRCTE